MTVKTILPLLMLGCLAFSAPAQPAPPQAPPPALPDTNAPTPEKAPPQNTPPGLNAPQSPPPTLPAANPPGVPPNRPVTPRAASRNPISPTPARPTQAAPASTPPAVPPANPAAPPATLTPPPAAQQPAGASAGLPGSVASTSAAPQEEMVGTDVLDLSAGADLEIVFDIYSKLTGRTILRPGNLKSEAIKFRAQTPLTYSEAIQALNSVLALNGISMIPVDEKFVKAVPKAQAIAEGAPLQRLDSTNLLELGPFVQHIVQLEYVKPSEIQPLLTMFASLAAANAVVPIDSSMTLVLRDNTENVKRMLEVIKEVDRAVPAEFISEVIPIKYAMASDIASALGSLSSGGAVTSSGISGRTGTTGAGRTGTSAASRFGMGGIQGQPGANPYGATQPGQLGQAGAQPSFTDRLQNIIKKASTTGSGDVVVLGPTKIVADERANSLLVFASKTDMAIITNIVAKLDVVLPQVLIEAIIMDVSLSDGQSMGVSYLQRPQQVGSYFTGVGGLNNVGFLSANSFSAATNGLSSLGSGLSYFGKFGQDFDATVTMAASDSRITVIQKPRVMTFHAKPASFFIGSTVPYVTSTSYYGSWGGYGGPSSQYQQLKVGIGLDVTPYINQDGLVVMEINQQIEEIDGYTKIENVGEVPNTASRTISAQVAVKDRETIILGGFIRSSDTKNNSGVPVLKDIPLLGFLFNKSSRNNERKELIVLMRPTVLRTPELAAATTKEEKLRLPGISDAEMRDNQVEERTAERMKRRLSEYEKSRKDKEAKFQDLSPDWKPGK